MVRVITHPWFIYSPFDASVGGRTSDIFIDSPDGYIIYKDPSTTIGVPQPYNQFRIRFTVRGDWAGRGKRKSDDDVVGNFIITDEDLNKTSIDKTDNSHIYGSGRMDW